jgi:hypothetical protein
MKNERLENERTHILNHPTYSSIMEILEQVFPIEILNLICTYFENGPVVTRYDLATGKMRHLIQWNSDDISQIEAMLMIKQFFPSYLKRISEHAYHYIYFRAKDYFYSVLIERRKMIPSR